MCESWVLGKITARLRPGSTSRGNQDPDPMLNSHSLTRVPLSPETEVANDAGSEMRTSSWTSVRRTYSPPPV